MKKLISILLMMVLLTGVLAGCANQNTTPTSTQKPDAVSSASLATDEAKLVKATSKDGAWIIILKNDMTTTKEIVIEGEFTKPNPTDAAKIVSEGRKLALYNQDANKVVTARYSLTAPKLTVKSIDTKIQSGTFVGDVYVQATHFYLVDAKVQGNIYFASDDLKSSFAMDAKSSVTGVQEVKK